MLSASKGGCLRQKSKRQASHSTGNCEGVGCMRRAPRVRFSRWRMRGIVNSMGCIIAFSCGVPCAISRRTECHSVDARHGLEAQLEARDFHVERIGVLILLLTAEGPEQSADAKIKGATQPSARVVGVGRRGARAVERDARQVCGVDRERGTAPRRRSTGMC